MGGLEMGKFLQNITSLKFMEGYRTYFAVVASVLGGLTLILQAVSAPDGPNWAQISVGMMGIGNALGFSGVVGKIQQSTVGTNAAAQATGFDIAK